MGTNHLNIEALYCRKCNTLVSWKNPTYRAVVGLVLLKEMEEQMSKTNQNLKVAQDKKKIYVDKGRIHKEFCVGDHVFLKVKDNRISLKLGNFSTMENHYYGSFEILDRSSSIHDFLTCINVYS